MTMASSAGRWTGISMAAAFAMFALAPDAKAETYYLVCENGGQMQIDISDDFATAEAFHNNTSSGLLERVPTANGMRYGYGAFQVFLNGQLTEAQVDWNGLETSCVRDTGTTGPSSNIESANSQNGNASGNASGGGANLPRWIDNGTYEREGWGTVSAASVIHEGVVLTVQCSAGNTAIQLELAPATGAFAATWDPVMREATAGDGADTFVAFSGGPIGPFGSNYYELDGSVAIEPAPALASPVISGLIVQSSTTFMFKDQSWSFPLGGSKAAICAALARCGLSQPNCG